MAKMDLKKCCMVGCDNVSVGSDGKENKKLFFVFPKDFNLCMLWVQNSGRPEYFEDFAFAGAQPFLARHICSEHFNDTDFINPKDPSCGLLAGAVPNLNFVFQKVEVKEEPFDPEYAEALTGTLLSESELINEIKLEKFENDNLDNANFSYTSTDDSCNDLGAKVSTKGDETYKETEEEKQLSNEFFRKYKSAMRGGNNKRPNESERERLKRLKREALRAKLRRSQESEEQKRMRRMKNALRAAFRRRNETPEQRELRKRKDMLRAQRRRKAETESEARIRRYNDAVRAAFRRNNETEEQRMARKMKDIMRAAKRRSMETPEQRETRLRKDRERASKRRMLKKIAEEMSRLNGLSEFGHLNSIIKADPLETEIQPLTMESICSIANQCNESSDLDRLQQVLEFIESKTSSKSKKRSRAEKAAELNEKPIYHVELMTNPNVVPCAVNCENEDSEFVDGDLEEECENEPEPSYGITDILQSTLPNELSITEKSNGGDSGNSKSPDQQYEITDISQSMPSHGASVAMNSLVDHLTETSDNDKTSTDLLEAEVVWG